MFGMLDYRAHRLFWLLSLPIQLAMLVLPYATIAAAIVLSVERFDALPLAIVVAVLGMEAAILLLQLLFAGVSWVFRRVFDFLVDVVPAEGRDRYEARAVLFGGQPERLLFNLRNDPENFDFEQQQLLVRSLKKSQGLLVRASRGMMGVGPDSWYHSRIEDRVDAALTAAESEHRNPPPDPVPAPAWLDQVLESEGLTPTRMELFLGQYRHIIYKYAFFLAAFIWIANAE